jgi:hypothetical protein
MVKQVLNYLMKFNSNQGDYFNFMIILDLKFDKQEWSQY